MSKSEMSKSEMIQPKIINNNDDKGILFQNIYSKIFKPNLPSTIVEHRKNGILHCENGPAFVNKKKGIEEYYFFGKKITKKVSVKLYEMKMARIKPFFRSWYDITYMVGKPGFEDRMNRDYAEFLHITSQ